MQLVKGSLMENSSGWKANLLLVVAKVGPSLRFHLTQTGGYAIWGHALAWDDNSDSFWVTWQRADPNEDAQATKIPVPLGGSRRSRLALGPN